MMLFHKIFYEEKTDQAIKHNCQRNIFNTEVLRIFKIYVIVLYLISCKFRLYLLRNCPIYPVCDHGLRGHPDGVEFVGEIRLPEPDQNQPNENKNPRY